MSLTKEELKLIGGSDAAAIAGVHPYKKPIDVWRRIVEGYDTPTTPAMKRGVRLEPVIREMFAEETGLKLLGPRSLRSPKHDWLRASLDDVADVGDELQVVEFKSVNARQAHRYGDGPDEVPDEHICQVQFYLGVTGWSLAHLAALIGGDELKHYRLISDAELQAALVEACERFWVDFVLTKRPPPADGSEGYSKWIDQHFSNKRADLIQADASTTRLVMEFRAACGALDEAKRQKALLQQKVEELIGEASGVEGTFGRIYYKRTKDRLEMDWEALAANLNVPDDVRQQFTIRKPGYRPLKPYWKEAK